jgi:hypothetical protein
LGGRAYLVATLDEPLGEEKQMTFHPTHVGIEKVAYHTNKKEDTCIVSKSAVIYKDGILTKHYTACIQRAFFLKRERKAKRENWRKHFLRT